ncbi:MAG: site-specific DNA-methyltransferase [Candidatus Auribacterota bacterium]
MQNVTINKIPISDLKPAEYNPRTISESAYSGLKSSIDRFGLVQPIIWNKRTRRIVGGHQRLKVLIDKGATETDAVIVDLEESEEKALNIALNNQHICGEWTESLEILLAEIRESTPDIYDDLLLDALLDDVPKNKDNTADEVEDNFADETSSDGKIIVQPGDIWLLGQHCLMCGDSTNGSDVANLMNSKQADMVFTDPPYGVSYCGTNNPNGRPWKIIEGDELRGDKLYTLLKASFTLMARHAKDTAAFYVFHAALNQTIFEQALQDAGIKIKQQVIWHKHHVLGHSDYHWSHEPCFYCYKADQNCDFFGDRTHKTVWEFAKDAAKDYVHPTQKPIGLAQKAIENNSRYGEIVLDMFGGSGSTLLACEHTGRKCYAMEIDPHYCDMIIKRWENVTGKKACRVQQ